MQPQPSQIFESDAERASNAYLVSTVVLVFGLPIPLVNMLATLFFYLGNRKQAYFVRFHCMQSLLSQIALMSINIIAFVWTIRIIFGSPELTNIYIGYMITIVLFNILEFIASLYASIHTRKKKDVRFWFFGELTQIICKP